MADYDGTNLDLKPRRVAPPTKMLADIMDDVVFLTMLVGSGPILMTILHLSGHGVVHACTP